MKYIDFANKVAKKANCPMETVRDVLYAIPSVVRDMEEGDSIRTPMGTIKMTKRKPRKVIVPGRGENQVPEKRVARLKPGSKMIFDS